MMTTQKMVSFPRVVPVTLLGLLLTDEIRRFFSGLSKQNYEVMELVHNKAKRHNPHRHLLESSKSPQVPLRRLRLTGNGLPVTIKMTTSSGNGGGK